MGERYGRGIKDVGAILPSLGIAYVAASLENAGHKVSIIDAPALCLDIDSTVKEVVKLRPTIVGITCISSNFRRCIELADKIKMEIKTKIFFGGPHVTLSPRSVLKNKSVDFVVIGEGEITSQELLASLDKDLKKVKGIGYKKGKKIVITEPRPFIKDLDSLPFPARHLLPMNRYSPAPNEYKRLPMITMVTSRGCPYSCTFCCALRLWTHVYRQRSIDNIIEEIGFLVKKYRIKDIGFFDELWGLKKDWIEKFCDRLIKEKFGIIWSCYTRADIISRLPLETLKKMHKAGCWRFYFGFESGNQDLLDNIKKGITIKEIRKAVYLTHKAGIEIMGNFMFALPGESVEKAMQTINFAIEIDPDIAKFNITTPHPETDLYNEVKSGKWGKMGGEMNKYTGYFPVFVPYGYKNAMDVERIKRLAYKKFYIRPKYLIKRFLKIRSIEDLRINIQGLKAIVKI